MPRIIGTLVSSGLCTLLELQTVYGTRDAYKLLEVINVDIHNQQRLRKWQAQQ